MKNWTQKWLEQEAAMKEANMQEWKVIQHQKHSILFLLSSRISAVRKSLSATLMFWLAAKPLRLSFQPHSGRNKQESQNLLLI